MKTNKRLTIFILLVFTLLITACSGRSSLVASGWGTASADEETAYLAFNTQVIAINLANGTERWRFPAEIDTKVTFYAAPVQTKDGQLIVGGYDNVLYSINPKNGQLNWKFEEAEGRYIGEPLVTANGIFAPSVDHKLYALDFNGNLQWQFETEEPLWASPAASPACECIFLPSMDHKIYAINAETGRQLWATEDLGGAIISTPAVSEDNLLFVGTFNNELVALDGDNGRELWRFPTQDWVWAGPALDGDTLYFGDLSGTLFSVNHTDGSVQWQIQPNGAIVGTPLVTEGGIFFTTEEGSIIAVDSSGEILFNQQTEENSYHAGPILAGESILVTTSDPAKLLIAIDPNGVQKWSFELK